MMDMPVKVRNRLQDGMINWQENRYRKSEERQQHADIRRARMTCSESLLSFRQTQDWTEGMGVSASGRFQVIEERKPKARLISGDGIRRDAAVILLVVLAVLMGIFLLADVGGLGTRSQGIAKLSRKIEAVENKNVVLRQELEMNTSSAAVCTEAVKMDLISSNGAQTIRLTAPQGVYMTLTSASAAEENADFESRMMSYAGD